ncbi:MAG: mono/diheme cytochrome c family protein, partial [Candidatus Binatia bacterium]
TGPIEVKGKKYGGPGAVPMPAMGGLTDQQIAEVLTYVRSAFGNKASAVTPAEVRAIRAVTATRETPWTVTELNP